jgi:amidophosphoribosyltransferase
MCGVIGIFGTPGENVNQAIYDGLTVLQHRGQDAAGIVTYENGRLYLRKDNGLVRDVFRTRHMRDLHGHIGIGHVRYPTAGSSSSAEAQPFYVNSPFGIAMGHNGNLTNAEELAVALYKEDQRHINTTSDSEILLNVFAHELQKKNTLQITPQDIFDAVRRVHARCSGGYAVVALIVGYGMVAFRDPYGLRPLMYGARKHDKGHIEYAVASESVATDVLGFKRVRDIEPGEAIFIDMKGELHAQACAANARYSPCIFEHVYFARPDSVIDGISVYQARLKMGEKLADKLVREWGADHDIDVVIPIPDTSRTSALQMAHRLGVDYREGFIKNRYIGRTFIMPGQKLRKKSVRQKLNAIDSEFIGKNVMLVDDSIVRGTTSAQIVEMAREAGANKVYFASASPPVRYPYVYGIDMPNASELIANGRTEQEVCLEIGADRILYQDLSDLVEATGGCSDHVKEFDTSCFSGCYVTGDVTPEYLQRLAEGREPLAKIVTNAGIDLHNHENEG